MYVGNTYQQYWKLDVRNEKPEVVWKYDAKVQGARGKSAHSVTLLGNNLYFNTGNDTPNPRLIALDKNSGEVVFDVSSSIPEAPNQGSSAAPLAVKDKIIVGTTGRNETGRGFVAAYAADTGQLLWKFLVVPEAGQPGSETWAVERDDGIDGRAVLVEGVIRSGNELGLFRHRQSRAHVRSVRAAPAFCTPAWVIALDVDTGKMKWYFQTIPNEAWDYDAVAITQLYDININGEARKVISHDQWKRRLSALAPARAARSSRASRSPR